MKTLLLIFFISFVHPEFICSQNIDDLVKQADALEKQFKEDEAYHKYKEVIKHQPKHLYALTRCSELASRIGRRQNTRQKQMDFYNAAKIYAERALKINPNDSEANLVMSLAYARMSLLKSGKEKVEFVREIKTYADRALIAAPDNFKALFVIGRWHYEISNLSVVERAAIKVFFGGLQKNSIDSAVIFFERVRALKPDFVLNYYELAKAYYKANKKTKAIELIKYLLKLPNTAADDPTIKEEAKQQLAKWTS